MMNKHFLFYGIILSFCMSASMAPAAINCATPPSCSSLGYADAASECPDNNVKCPFDTNMVKCLPTLPSCSSLGYTNAESRCPDNNIKCPFDISKVKCLKPYAREGDCYYSDGHTGTCKSDKNLVGMVFETANNGEVVGFVTEVLLPVTGTGTWYQAQEGCAKYSAVVARGIYYNGDGEGINNFFTAIGKSTDFTSSTTVWSREETADKAWRYIGNSGSLVPKTESHKYFCSVHI